MGKGAGFGKTIFIGDQFVLHGVPAIVAGLSFETVATVERIDGAGWVLEDNRIEVPGYKEKKNEQKSFAQGSAVLAKEGYKVIRATIGEAPT